MDRHLFPKVRQPKTRGTPWTEDRPTGRNRLTGMENDVARPSYWNDAMADIERI